MCGNKDNCPLQSLGVFNFLFIMFHPKLWSKENCLDEPMRIKCGKSKAKFHFPYIDFS